MIFKFCSFLEVVPFSLTGIIIHNNDFVQVSDADCVDRLLQCIKTAAPLFSVSHGHESHCTLKINSQGIGSSYIIFRGTMVQYHA